MPTTFAEKRQYPRLKVTAPLSYQIRGLPQQAHALSNTLSAGGLSFVNNNFIPVNTCISFEINVLSKALNPIGIVRWSQPLSHSDRYQAGIEFLEWEPAQKKYLCDYLKMRLGTV